MTDRDAAVQELVDWSNSGQEKEILDGWVRAKTPSDYAPLSDDDVFFMRDAIKNRSKTDGGSKDERRARSSPQSRFFDEDTDGDFSVDMEGIKDAYVNESGVPVRVGVSIPADYKAPETITIELRKDDVIRMLKGSNAPAGMLWDERSMNEYSIEDLMEIYAQLNWSGQPVQEQEAPRIFVPGAQ